MIEGSGPNWLYGTGQCSCGDYLAASLPDVMFLASEHHVEYQYYLNSASNGTNLIYKIETERLLSDWYVTVFIGFAQTETVHFSMICNDE
jgi:hypothetical protein